MFFMSNFVIFSDWNLSKQSNYKKLVWGLHVTSDPIFCILYHILSPALLSSLKLFVFSDIFQFSDIESSPWDLSWVEMLMKAVSGYLRLHFRRSLNWSTFILSSAPVQWHTSAPPSLYILQTRICRTVEKWVELAFYCKTFNCSNFFSWSSFYLFGSLYISYLAEL